MERFVLCIHWERRAESGAEQHRVPQGLAYAQDIYTQLKEYSTKYTSTFPACSLTGNPGTRKWFFALQSLYGSFQFCSSDWDDLCPAVTTEDNEEPVQTALDECLEALQFPDGEDDNSRDSISQTNLFEEAAELLHQLSDKLPAPGRALVDVLLFTPEAPKLKDCLSAIGAIKHLKEWHSAKITIVSKDCKGWQKIAKFLSANVVESACPKELIDSHELWRGNIEISERKFTSEVEFPEFCLRSVSDDKFPYFEHNGDDKNKAVLLPEVFHYYGTSLEYVQMVALSEIPSYFVSDSVFELITRNALQGKSKLMLDQLCSLTDKVGAIFMLSCNVCSLPNPPALQRSSKKWREYMSRKPKDIKVPGVELKGEYCSYYFLIQGKGSGFCKATLLHSASQISGAASLVLLHQRLNNYQPGNMAEGTSEILDSVPHFRGEQIAVRERILARAQALAVNEYLKRHEALPHPSVSHVNNLRTLLAVTRERVIGDCESRLDGVSYKNLQNITVSTPTVSESEAMISNPADWPERNVLQNLENFEKVKQRLRASILSSSAEQLLGRKDGLKEGMTLLDAKELLKYFTPQGIAVGELQPLQVQRGDNAFLLTPKLTPKKLKGLPFEKAAECHYHGLEYCLDNRKALDRDVAFSELQSRLIRYETQTTCTRECCPVPFALSPLPSPAVLSEPGSVPDGESIQTELRGEPLLLKRRSRDLDGLYASKRLAKSGSSDSLVSLASEGSGHQPPTRATRLRPERAASSTSAVQPPSARVQMAPSVPAQSKQSTHPDLEQKESRSQKHNRMLKEVVSKTLQKYGIGVEHPCYAACNQRLFDISKFFLKDLKTSRGLLDEMKKAASNNAKQVIQWELDKLKKK
ncbi:mdm2-binding protein isoform X1 [Xenopus tropicalis]|uniref:Mdm2-binding protein isoform X1 n=1 Tax=Xenopus tropicalis TaxID=8364 RepID=A0A8J0SGJ5_XENTR|nr:mdm2-binding protein isoform X1 [Xenopus tropicalis]